MESEKGREGKSSDHISRCGVEAVDPLAGNFLVSFFSPFGEREREKRARAGVSLGKNTLPAAHGNKIGHSAPIWLVCFH